MDRETITQAFKFAVQCRLDGKWDCKRLLHPRNRFFPYERDYLLSLVYFE